MPAHARILPVMPAHAGIHDFPFCARQSRGCRHAPAWRGGTDPAPSGVV